MYLFDYVDSLIIEHYKRFLVSSGNCKSDVSLKDYLLSLEMYGREVGDILKYTVDYRAFHFALESLASKTQWPDGRGKRKWGAKMTFKVASELTVFFEWAHKFGFTQHQPLKDGHLFHKGKDRKPEFFEWDSEDFKCLLHHPKNNVRDLAIFHVFRASGSRVTETSNLNIEDVLLDEAVIKIEIGKGGDPRFAPLDDDAVKFLSSYIKALFRMGYQPSDCLFPAIIGRKPRYRAHSIWKMIYMRGKDMGIRAYPHKIRHSLAGELLERGCDILSISEAYGHKDLNTTRRYTHLTKIRMKKIYNKTMSRQKTIAI